MPELPEITHLAKQFHTHLSGKVVQFVDVLQPKSLNMPVNEFRSNVTGATWLSADNRGKWIRVRTNQGWLLINLGMGGELLLVNREKLPEKKRLIFYFDDGTCLSANFWWFGYVHFVNEDSLSQHTMTAKLGPNALDINLDEFKKMLTGQRSAIKTFLLDQSHLAGIGNAYIHDILFLSRVHPLRKISSLNTKEVESIWQAIQDGLRPSIEKGGAFYEVDLFGEKGGFTMEDILVGYKEGQPCPRCSMPIEKIKTGSTSSFVCPVCQPYRD